MATKALQAAHRCERCFQALDSLGRPGPSEVTGADCGEKIEPDIGGRGPMGEYWRWVFLEIVGRQHVVRHRDESLEVAPRKARASVSETTRRPATSGDRLVHRATPGDAIHSTTNGAAATQASPPAHQTTIAATMPMTTPPAI